MISIEPIIAAHDLNGLAVVGLTDGQRLGRVADVSFDPASGAVGGFWVDRGGMFSKPKFLAAGDVQGLGSDALTVASESVFAETEVASANTPGISAKAVMGRPVLSSAGMIQGKVAMVFVNTSTLTVPYVTLATGLLDNVLHGKPHLPLSAIQTVGADSVIVTDTYDPKL